MSTLPVSDIVNVTVQVSAMPPAAQSFSGMLILGSSARLDLAHRVQAFTVDSVGSTFAVSDHEYTAAMKAFSQSPAPSTIYIGRRFTGSASAGSLNGGASGNAAALAAITAGAFDVTVDATVIHVTALNLSGIRVDTLAHALADTAGLIQTKLQAGLASTTCVVDLAGTGLNIVSPTTGINSKVSYATVISTDATTAGTLGLSTAEGATKTAGIAAETTITDSLNACKLFSAGWYSFVTTSDTLTADQCLAADWAEANGRPYFATTNAATSYAAPDVSDIDIAGYAFRKGYAYTAVFYSTDSLDLGASAMARIVTTDYTQPNSVITLWGKQCPGVTPESISENTKIGLDGKNCNAYLSFGNYAMLYQGKTGGGRFVDEVIGLAWQAAQIQNEVFTVLATSPTKIAQTDAGVGKLVKAMESALRKGVVNGLLAPGYWPTTNNAVGNVNPGDFLDQGYYVVAAPVSSQSTADRATRVSPAITGIACGAGALQSTRITFIFNR